VPTARAIARNADRNPNLEVSMEGKHGYKMPKKSMKMNYSMDYGMKNSIRAANVKRQNKGKKHNPGY